MPKIELRPAMDSDIPGIMNIDHNYSTEYVWQMEIDSDDDRVGVNFRRIHLPRSVRVEYPRSLSGLAEEWTQRSGMLVAILDDELAGYISLMLGIAPETTWVSDLAVLRRFQRNGIGSTLVLAAQEWAFQNQTRRIVLEMQHKNYAAIQLAKKLGFDFCGYNDRYYANHDIGLFFAKSLR
jgi:ribosomal protein S18 acetylase RimI-like enzyme